MSEDRLIEHPPLIVYEKDMDRLREYGVRHRLGDSATALRKLLDDGLRDPPTVEVWLRADPCDGNDPLEATLPLSSLPRIGDQIQVWDDLQPHGGAPVFLRVVDVIHTAWAPEAVEVIVRLDEGYDVEELRRAMTHPEVGP